MKSSIKINFYDPEADQDCLFMISLGYFVLKIFITKTARFSGYLDYKDHSKGIRQSSRGFHFEIDFEYQKERIVYFKKE